MASVLAFKPRAIQVNIDPPSLYGMDEILWKSHKTNIQVSLYDASINSFTPDSAKFKTDKFSKITNWVKLKKNNNKKQQQQQKSKVIATSLVTEKMYFELGDLNYLLIFATWERVKGEMFGTSKKPHTFL